MRLLNIALAIGVSALMALFVLELGLRVIGLGPPETGLRFDEELGWALESDSSFDNSGSEFDVTIETNALGLRDDLEAAAKPDGTFRVLCLGDSFTLGYTCSRDDLFVDGLERWWKAEGRNVDVVNAGVQGYSTDQQLRWLELNHAAFEPDLVLFFPYENDLYWNTRGEYVGAAKPQYDAGGALVSEQPLVDTNARTTLEKTALGNWLLRDTPAPDRIEVPGTDAMVLAEQAPLVPALSEITDAAGAVTRALFARAVALGNDAGFDVAVCPLPSHSQVDATYAKEVMGAKILRLAEDQWDAEAPYALLAGAARAAGARVLDPLPALKAAQADAAQYHDVDWHLSPAGNRTLATYLHAELEGTTGLPAGSNETTLAAAVGAANAKGAGIPGWLPWFLGLWLVLGGLFVKTYPSENAGASFLKVGLLLGAVFAIAIGITALLAVLPPKIAQIVLIALLLALFTFIAYKLGDRIGTGAELLKAFTLRGHWYLMPLLTILVTIGSLLVVAASSPLVAPFIYTLF